MEARRHRATMARARTKAPPPRPHTTPSPTALPPRVKESRWRSALATSPTVAATTQNARMAPLLAHSCGRSERPCYDGSVAGSAFRFWFTIIVIPTLLVVGALGYLAWRQSVSGVRAAFDRSEGRRVGEDGR